MPSFEGPRRQVSVRVPSSPVRGAVHEPSSARYVEAQTPLDSGDVATQLQHLQADHQRLLGTVAALERNQIMLFRFLMGELCREDVVAVLHASGYTFGPASAGTEGASLAHASSDGTHRPPGPSAFPIGSRRPSAHPGPSRRPSSVIPHLHDSPTSD